MNLVVAKKTKKNNNKLQKGSIALFQTGNLIGLLGMWQTVCLSSHLPFSFFLFVLFVPNIVFALFSRWICAFYFYRSMKCSIWRVCHLTNELHAFDSGVSVHVSHARSSCKLAMTKNSCSWRSRTRILNCISNGDSISIHNLSAELLALPVSGVVVVAGIYLHRARCMSACFYAAAPLARMHLRVRIFRKLFVDFCRLLWMFVSDVGACDDDEKRRAWGEVSPLAPLFFPPTHTHTHTISCTISCTNHMQSLICSHI